MIETIIVAIWLMLPAYISNPLAALFGGGKPIDCGINFKDGRRLLGDGKTYRGLLFGIIGGLVVGIIQMIFISNISNLLQISFPPFSHPSSSTIIIILSLSGGALFGDMFKSFFKRRMGFKRGQSFPIVDQLDFVIGAWIAAFIFVRPWFMMYFNTKIILIILFISPIIHLVVNIFGFLIGVKKEPW